MASANMASVWGNGKASLLAAINRKLEEGEEECMICRDDVPASVKFSPCNHVVCFGCVESMRARNIFKVCGRSRAQLQVLFHMCQTDFPFASLQADKGVRCPFCRQFIEQYTSLQRYGLPASEFCASRSSHRTQLWFIARTKPSTRSSQRPTGQLLWRALPVCQKSYRYDVAELDVHKLRKVDVDVDVDVDAVHSCRASSKASGRAGCVTAARPSTYGGATSARSARGTAPNRQA